MKNEVLFYSTLKLTGLDVNYESGNETKKKQEMENKLIVVLIIIIEYNDQYGIWEKKFCKVLLSLP